MDVVPEVVDIDIVFVDTGEFYECIFVVFGDGESSDFVSSGVSNGGDDFSWMNIWTVRSKQDEKSGSQVESIIIGKAESASAEIKWKDDKFLWYQEGD